MPVQLAFLQLWQIIITTLLYRDARLHVDTLMDIIEDFVADDHTIEIRHFGTFIPRKRKARLARVPKKGGREIMLPERYIPIIKFSSILKDSINEKNNNR